MKIPARHAFIACALLGALAAPVILLASPDPSYRLHGWLAMGRYRAHDTIIREEAQKAGVDPLLLKAMAWRESGFSPALAGTGGGRGLLQITISGGTRWAAAMRLETFMPSDLFDPQTNLRAGAWLLAGALKHWAASDRPEIFALAELKAGRARVLEWNSGASNAAAMLARADEGVRAYIHAVTSRRDYYQRHGW